MLTSGSSASSREKALGPCLRWIKACAEISDVDPPAVLLIQSHHLHETTHNGRSVWARPGYTWAWMGGESASKKRSAAEPLPDTYPGLPGSVQLPAPTPRRPYRSILEDKRANHDTGEKRTQAPPQPGPGRESLLTRGPRPRSQGGRAQAPRPLPPSLPAQNTPGSLQPPPCSLPAAECDPRERGNSSSETGKQSRESGDVVPALASRVAVGSLSPSL